MSTKVNVSPRFASIASASARRSITSNICGVNRAFFSHPLPSAWSRSRMPHSSMSSAPRPSLLVTMRRNRIASRNPSQLSGMLRVTANVARSSMFGARLPNGATFGIASRMSLRCQCGQAAQCADPVAAQHLIEPRLIVGQLGAVVFGMPEMKNAGRKASVLAPHAGMDEADGEIGILQAPAVETGIEAVDANEVTARDREIAGPRAFPAPRLRLAQHPERQAQCGGKTVDAFAPMAQQRGDIPCFRFELLRKHNAGQRFRKKDAVAGHEPARFGKAAVLRHEVGARNAVAIEKHAIIASARRNRAVADLGGTESAVRLAYMRE